MQYLSSIITPISECWLTGAAQSGEYHVQVLLLCEEMT